MTASKERIIKICEYCGKSFYASKSTTRYCSKQCNSYAYKAARREEKVKMAETMSHREVALIVSKALPTVACFFRSRRCLGLHLFCRTSSMLFRASPAERAQSRTPLCSP